MAGHSKWANIKHQKEKQDAKRGKLFTKLIREIVTAARLGGGDVKANPRLRDAVAAALAGNMTRDTIERATKRGAGGLEGENIEEVLYEGYGPAGTAVMVECMTDNRNRTVSLVRHAFSKCGGNLGTDGSVAYLFKKRGIITFSAKHNENDILEVALEAGAEDVITNDDGTIDVISAPETWNDIKEALAATKLEPETAEITQLPATWVNLDKEAAEKMMRLIDMLEDLDDVQNVYTNADISADIMQALGE